MQSSRKIGFVFVLFVVACSENSPDPFVYPPAETRQIAVNHETLPPPERLQWDIGGDVEGFGGLFADSSGALVSLTTDMERADVLRSAVRARTATSNSTARLLDGRERPLRINHARFTYRSLLEWKNILSMSDTSGLIGGIGVVESKNRILVLVEDPGSIPVIRQHANQLGIPSEAFVIARTRAESTQNLQTGYFRPTTGGIRIQAGSGNCSLWGNAVVEGVRYGITASHCTSVMGTVTPDPVYQAGGYIGSEAIDPPWTVQDRHPECINGTRSCRYSDAAAFSYDQSVSSGKTVARISGTPCGFACWGPMTAIAPDRLNSWVVDYPMDGEVVDKIGSTTGWSRGWVEGSCFDIRVGSYRKLCTVRVVTSVHPGDSGGPVFFMYGDNARPTGILWGRDWCRNTFPNLDDGSCPSPGWDDPSYPSNAMYMSAWWAIRQELGFPDASVGWP